eukprot:8844505-Ditylum_brightwellii.AAC.1
MGKRINFHTADQVEWQLFFPPLENMLGSKQEEFENFMENFSTVLDAGAEDSIMIVRSDANVQLG